MGKIRILSIVLRIIFILALIFLPIFTTLFWLTGGYPLGSWMLFTVFPYTGPSLPLISLLPTQFKIYGYLINLIPILFDMAILYYLIRLFREFGKANIFTINNVIYIRRIGWLMLIGEIISPFYTLLLTFTLTYNNPPGYRYAYLGLDLQNVTIGLVALLIILVSWIMQEGHRIHEENRLTV